MFGMSPMELMIIFLIVLLVFGAKRLPDLAKSMGKAIREFKGATEKMQEEFVNLFQGQCPSWAVKYFLKNT